MPDGNALTGSDTATVREISRGYGIESVLAYAVGGMPYEETDLWRYDHRGGMIHMFGAGSDGSVHDHTGRWKDAGTLELHWKGVQEGGVRRHRPHPLDDNLRGKDRACRGLRGEIAKGVGGTPVR